MTRTSAGRTLKLFITLIISCVFTGTAFSQKSERPNILWIFVEDISPLISSYGLKTNPTPHIDNLAKNGILFTKAFAAAPVCSPARSAVITGMMASSIGAHQHHSSRTVESANWLPDYVKSIPELFRNAGYYTFNQGKEDYNFIYNRRQVYDDEGVADFYYTFSGKGHWRDEARRGKPFFGQIQLNGGKHALGDSYKAKFPLKWIDRKDVVIPPYYPDNREVREDWARHHDEVRITDYEVSQLIEDLKKDGLLENTIIFFFSDHGYRGIRHKQFCYDGGLNIPLIIADFGNHLKEKNTIRRDLVSAIDLGPTSLAIAGLDVPAWMEGKDMLDKKYQREYIIATRDRCDFSIDKIRAVRTEKFKYLRNYMPDRAYTQPSYRDFRPEFVSIQKMYKDGKLNDVQAKYWKPTKPEEELFDLENDPHEINNLASDPEYKRVLEQHRGILNNWIKETDDKGQYPEDIENLRFMYERWGDKCVNPEFDIVKKTQRFGTPKRNLKE